MLITRPRHEPVPLAGRFLLGRKLGHGSAAVVWEAHDRITQQRVAVKLPWGLEEPIENEARALEAARHPSVPKLIGYACGPRPFLALELVEGMPLSELLRRGPLDFDRSLQVSLSLASALAAAHRAGWVHQDVKPANVLLDPRGAAHLVDFGIAARVGAEGAGMGGTRWLGTAGYLAPEQLTDHRLADPRADVFALGCVLFECATGRRALSRQYGEIARGEWGPDAHPILDLDGVPPQLRAPIADCCAVRPSLRPRDGAEAFALLRNCEGPEARPC